MRILISNARIIDPTSPHHGKDRDILIDGGKIIEIGAGIDGDGADEVIEGEGLKVSIGWVDLFATIGDPGFEHRETVVSALDAAANGGFIRIVVSPKSLPATDSKSCVEYLLKQARGHTVGLLPLAAITKGLEGRELAEMYDMVNSGATGVSNAKRTISDSKVMQLAMQYAEGLNRPFYSFTEDERMGHGTQMHEGDVSTRLGLRGTPALAEELAVTRDLYLARYTGATVHFPHITTKGAVQLIREAKAEGMKVTASVPAHHLLFTDETVQTFDSNYKVRPPFRNSTHVDALWEGLKDGTLDAIISDHEALEVEAKFMEFGQAKAGITALETLLPALLRAAEGQCELALLIEKLTTGPRKVLGMEAATIAEGQPAELTIFSTEVEWVYNEDTACSLSKNSPLWGHALTGRTIAVLNGEEIAFAKF
ncbi:MAG: dihydroorotase [Flavobacteriales bacterium]|nr:dihydroorotase [Flavobacteriales bacterium]